MSNPLAGYTIRYVDKNTGFVGTSVVPFAQSSVVAFSDPYASGGTAANWIGPYAPSTAAEYQFQYIFDASAEIIQKITVLGELDLGPSGDIFQTITMAVPPAELTRMFLYDSAWGSTGGTSAPYGVGGGTAVSGTQPAPNTALLLQYVLSALNVDNGITGQISGVSGQVNRLAGFDTLFNVQTPTIPQNGVRAPGNPWGITGPTGPNGSLIENSGSTGIQSYPVQRAGYFLDDGNTVIAQLSLMLQDPAAGLSGTSGYTFSPNSLLNSIPIEAIKSIITGGRTIPLLSGPTGILQDIDTSMTEFRAPLQNLFEQAVAYGRVSNNVMAPLSSMGSLPVNGASPWKTGSRIYGVDFQVSDSITLYLSYGLGQRRQYGIDPTVVTSIPGFTNAPVYSLTYNGRTFNIPVGSRDPTLPYPPGVPNTNYYPNNYNMNTLQNLQNERATNSAQRLIQLKLVALPANTLSNFDY